jgi:organic hydroperoxide reductase OsmC/OhrA
VGDDASFSPDDLLAMAVSACLMRTFLGLAEAAQVSVPSYTSTATLEGAADLPRVVLHSYLVTPSAAEGDRLRSLFEQARRSSPICGILGDRVACEAHVQVVAGVDGVS